MWGELDNENYQDYCLLFSPNTLSRPRQWSSGSALRIDRQEMPGSIPSNACWPSCLEFFIILSENRINTG